MNKSNRDTTVDRFKYIEIRDELRSSPEFQFGIKSQNRLIKLELESQLYKNGNFVIRDLLYESIDRNDLEARLEIGDSVSLWLLKEEFEYNMRVPHNDIYGSARLRSVTLEIYGLSINGETVYSIEDYEKYLFEDKKYGYLLIFFGVLVLIPNLWQKNHKKANQLTLSLIFIFSVISIIIYCFLN